MEKKKRNAIEWAMHYRQLVILVVTCLIAFGIYSLPQMRKNEFPDFTIRQGLVVAVAPGNTAQQMAEEVAKPLEEYIFTYKEVRKEKTFSQSRDGITYIQVELNADLNNKDEFWSKFKHGVTDFKASLPSNVLAVKVLDDFGDTSALLITMESQEKTYRELNDYMDLLKTRLSRISSVGRMSVSGMQKEQISVYLDNERLSKYGLSEQTLAATLFSKGFATSGGRMSPGRTGTSLPSCSATVTRPISTAVSGTRTRTRNTSTTCILMQLNSLKYKGNKHGNDQENRYGADSAPRSRNGDSRIFGGPDAGGVPAAGNHGGGTFRCAEIHRRTHRLCAEGGRSELRAPLRRCPQPEDGEFLVRDAEIQFGGKQTDRNQQLRGRP